MSFSTDCHEILDTYVERVTKRYKVPCVQKKKYFPGSIKKNIVDDKTGSDPALKEDCGHSHYKIDQV